MLLIGNIVKDPANPKFKKIKTTNKLMQEKILPAKHARALLLAVGFAPVRDAPSSLFAPRLPALRVPRGCPSGLCAYPNHDECASARQVEGHAELEMVGEVSEEAQKKMRGAIGHMKRTISGHRLAEQKARAEVVRRNAELSKKMRKKQEEDTTRKAAMAATIKRQRELQQEEAAQDKAPKDMMVRGRMLFHSEDARSRQIAPLTAGRSRAHRPPLESCCRVCSAKKARPPRHGARKPVASNQHRRPQAWLPPTAGSAPAMGRTGRRHERRARLPSARTAHAIARQLSATGASCRVPQAIHG